LLCERALILATALALDRLGEPPAAWHPVGWIGRLIDALIRHAPDRPRLQLWYGGLIAFAPTALAGLAMGWIDDLASHAPWPIRVLVRAAALSWTFSLAGLEEAARTVAADLDSGHMEAARISVRSLVSRPTAELEDTEIAAAAIESLAENASDSVIAPLLWWSIGGPTAAAAYRAINTADAMVGYHGRYELLGRFSARLDDAVNFVPARLTGLALCVISRRSAALRMMRRDHGRTESPNAGWPMAAMAGALDRRLAKSGHYVLGHPAPAPSPADILRAVGLVHRAVAMTLPLLCLPGRHGQAGSFK
jgi:adenosylcobinamide-phosphate synthase